ncbi:hypothetical protein ASD81_16270 [Nocardioides sp. Root614]|nr:hypothetical protein ASD81_16270 [Nocardioides sp. Root614]KRA87668.1 hypothetical protein ASD84_16540 [Nocardioides sp. Root682]
MLHGGRTAGVNGYDYSTNADNLHGSLDNDLLDGRDVGGKTFHYGEEGDDRLYGAREVTTSMAVAVTTTFPAMGSRTFSSAGTATRAPMPSMPAPGNDYLHGGSGVLDKGHGQASADRCVYIRNNRQNQLRKLNTVSTPRSVVERDQPVDDGQSGLQSAVIVPIRAPS